MANDRAAAPDSQGSAKSASQSSNQGSTNKAGQNADHDTQKGTTTSTGAQKGKDNVPSTPIADKQVGGAKQGAQVPGRTPAEVNPDSNKAYGPGGGNVQDRSETSGGKPTSRPGTAQSGTSKPGSNLDSRTSEVDESRPDRTGNDADDTVPR